MVKHLVGQGYARVALAVGLEVGGVDPANLPKRPAWALLRRIVKAVEESSKPKSSLDKR